MTEQQVFIRNTPVEEARKRYLDRLTLAPTAERLATEEALDRVTATAVYAVSSSPNSNQAAMDGIAVVASQTRGARETRPLDLLPGRDFVWINTGNTLEPPYDAVVMVEELVSLPDGGVRLFAAVPAWQHVRPIGEDLVAREMIVPSGQRLRPVDLAALIAGGVESLEVWKKPRVAILPTGNEIVQQAEEVRVGTIRDTNSLLLAGLLAEQGAQALPLPVVADDKEALRRAFTKALDQADVLLVLAGSSAGQKDHTAPLLAELGEVVVHGVAMKPGKPVVLALVDGKPVLGLPGFAVSCYLAAETFLRPLLSRLTGRPQDQPQQVTAHSARPLVSSVKSEEHVRVQLGWIDDRLVAAPLAGGAGVLMSLVRADGIGVIPRSQEGLAAGEPLRVTLLRPLAEIQKKLFVVGSHDLVVDVLADLMPLSSAHVGSQAGLLALKKREANLAPTHLLDAQSGVYNVAAVRRFFPQEDMLLIKGVERIQGLMLPRGNPKNIRGIQDLARPDLVFANRQLGAGTRVLLEHLLAQAGIETSAIQGYERALATHLAVASAVASGSADVGLGVLSAARALELDFLPVGKEDYDFLIPAASLQDPRIERFLDCLTSARFRRQVEKLGGYGFARLGELLPVGPEKEA